MSNVIAAVDRAAVRRNAETHSELLDYVAPRLARLANHGLLRIAVAAGLRPPGTGGHGGRSGADWAA